MDSSLEQAIIPVEDFQEKIEEMEACGYRLVSFASSNDGALPGTYLLVFRKGGRHQESREVIRLGDVIIDLVSREVKRGDKNIHFTRSEFNVLAFLARDAGKVFSSEEIVSSLNRDYASLSTREAQNIVKVYIRRIRRKLEDGNPGQQYIINARGFGYKAEPPTP